MEYSEEQIIGMSEAYGMFQILPKEAQQKIPKDFVQRLKKYANSELGYPINSRYSMESTKLSDEGIKLMAYMCLFLK